MKEKTSIFDEEYIEENNFEKLKNKTKNSNIPQKNNNNEYSGVLIEKGNFRDNFWKYLLAFLLALFLFWLIWYFFLQNKNNYTAKNYYNSGSIENFNKENNSNNGDNSVNTKDYNTKKFCDENSQKLKEELEKLKQLIYLRKDLNNFLDNTNQDNLEKNFNNLKEKNKFLENEIIKKQKEIDKDIKEIYDNLNNSFGNKITYASTEEGLGIEANDKDMSIIIPKNSSFPIKKSRIYYTRNPYQKRMEFKVYRGNDKLTKNNKFLGKFIIPNLTPIKEVGPRVEVIFDVQKDGKINFIAKDIKFPKNVINGYLDSEVDLLKKTNKDVNKIKDNFEKIEEKVDKKLIKESQKDNIKILKPGEYKVEKVIDGDTFSFLLDGDLVYARMIGIDAPENSTLRYGYTELFSQESTNFLKEKIEGKIVKLEYDNSQDKIDKYGRHLVYVFLNGENINNTMILEGYAKEFTYNKKYKYFDLFKKSENVAKKNKIGMWK